jgi:hypothetical protein
MLDSSRRLRMDDRRPSFLLHDLCGQIGSDAVPIAADIQYSAELEHELAFPGRDPIERRPADLPHQSSLIVYCGGNEAVGGGFAIALRAMGVEANVLHRDIALATNSPNREDN